MSPWANNLLHRQRKAPDVSFCIALQNSTWSFSFPLPQNSQVRFGVPFYAHPVGEAARRLADAAVEIFYKRTRNKKFRVPQEGGRGYQGLGCRLGRCFCALHRGVHRTPAPFLRNQRVVTGLKPSFSVNFSDDEGYFVSNMVVVLVGSKTAVVKQPVVKKVTAFICKN